MSGIYKGAQAIFSSCSAHTLNLCGVHAAELSTEEKIFWKHSETL